MSTTAEIWKDIPECPKYQASTFGKIRNKETGIILKPCVTEWGYEMLHLRYNSKSHTRYVHKLVAETFIPNPENKPEVNHEDGNKTNNRVENLSWVTHSENEAHAYRTGLKAPSDKTREHARRMGTDPKTRQAAFDRHSNIRVIETGEIFESNIEAAEKLGCHPQGISGCLRGVQKSCGGFHLEYTDEPPTKAKKQIAKTKPFLYDFQMEAVKKAFNGCILNGDVGTGKSRTGLFVYFKEQGGWIEGSDYTPMKNPKDLIILTTAMKRDRHEWDSELAWYRLSTNPETNYYSNTVIIDSWNNIKKYKDYKDCYFILDEDRVRGSGAWTKTFLRIAKNNDWIMLSATPGDEWLDFWAVFVANGFYRNKTDFIDQHVNYDPRCRSYPRIIGYRNIERLTRLRNRILIDMDIERHTVLHHEDVYCDYDIPFYKDIMRRRWDPYRNEPIQQASGLCYILRRIVNSHESRQVKLLELLEDHPKAIIFYNFDYEREILLGLGYAEETEVAEWSGHAHMELPTGDKWVYLVQYTAGCEGWCAITTDTMIFFSQNYSYTVMKQAEGRINRLNTKFIDLYYYHLKSRSGIDLAISKALREKKRFNEQRWLDSWK